MWLLNEKGAFGAGHVAILLIDDNGQGEFYSYSGRYEFAAVGILPKSGTDSYLSTVVDANGNNATINVKDFFNSKGDYDNDGEYEWIIKGTDAIDRPNSFIVDQNNKDDKKYMLSNGQSYDPYTYGVSIPITNDEGIAMHNKALSIRENPKRYNLWDHNCNQVAQEILSAGGKDFASQHFALQYTAPNIVKDSIIAAINTTQNSNAYLLANPSNALYDEDRLKMYNTWLYGSLDVFSYINDCGDK